MIAFASALISLPIFLINWFIYMARIRKDWSLQPDYLKAPFPLKSVSAFAITVFFGMLIVTASQDVARKSITQSLAQLNDSFQIEIDGTPVANKHNIISALQSLSWIPAHHSHPTKRILVEASNNEIYLRLALARDSSNSQEYWVFVPDYYVTSKNEIGRIVSSAFASYK